MYDLLSAGESARFLNLDYRTFKKRIVPPETKKVPSGYIKPVALSKKGYLFERRDVEKLGKEYEQERKGL